MSKLEQHHQVRIDAGNNPAEVDRETAQLALTGVLRFFLDHGIESKPLVRLLTGLVALTEGSSRPAIFNPVAKTHRRPDPPIIEAMKGRLAAIMEFRQRAGLTRKAAGEWVVRHLPPKMKQQLGSPSRTTVDSWLAKWGGQHGSSSSGREGYLHMRAILESGKPSEQQLIGSIGTLVKSLPS
jgi:hypothetical protein